MFDYLTHYYNKGFSPFQSLSALTDSEAIKIMESLYDDNPLVERFKEPIQYLNNRKQTEKWVRDEFIAKGGQPKEEYPLYAVLGNSNWIENHLATFDLERIQIPISIFNEYDICFTFPDSMVSYWLGKDKPANYYQPEYHGQIFTLSEAKKALINIAGIPQENWRLPEDVIPYIEVQIWNHKTLLTHVGIASSDSLIYPYM